MPAHLGEGDVGFRLLVRLCVWGLLAIAGGACSIMPTSGQFRRSPVLGATDRLEAQKRPFCRPQLNVNRRALINGLRRASIKVACPEEIAYRMGFITRAQLVELAHSLLKSGYGEYLTGLLDSE